VAAVVLSLPIIRFRIAPKRRLHGRSHVVAIQQFLAQGIQLTERRIGPLTEDIAMNSVAREYIKRATECVRIAEAENDDDEGLSRQSRISLGTSGSAGEAKASTAFQPAPLNSVL
jgi:hypothetical protein